MKGKSLRKLFLIISAIGCVFSLGGSIVCGTFVKTHTENVAEYQDTDEFYSSKGFDLIVQGPSKEQIDGFKVRQDVSHCVSYLEIELFIKIQNSQKQSNVLVFDNIEELKYTENTDERIIKNKEGLTNPVYIDYQFSKINNLKIGDKFLVYIDSSPKECSVARIYKTDFLYKKGVIIASTEIVPSSIKSGVYLKSNNFVSLREELKSYKPLGTLLPKTQYQTDEQYQQYVDEFYAKDYSSYIFGIKNEEMSKTALSKAESSKKGIVVSSIIFGVLLLLVSLGSFILVAKNKNDFIKKYIRDNGAKEPRNCYLVFNLLMLCCAAVANVIILLLTVNKTAYFISFGSALAANLVVLLVPVLSIVLGLATTLVLIKKS